MQGMTRALAHFQSYPGSSSSAAASNSGNMLTQTSGADNATMSVSDRDLMRQAREGASYPRFELNGHSFSIDEAFSVGKAADHSHLSPPH